MKYIVDSESLGESLAEFRGDNPRVIAVDTETTGLSPHFNKVRLVQIAWDSNKIRKSFVFDLFKIGDYTPLKEILEGKVIKLFYNAKFDINMLRGAGISVTKPVKDLMLYFGVLTNGEVQRPNLAIAYNMVIDPDQPMETKTKKKNQQSDWAKWDLDQEQLEYAAHDADILLDMFPILRAAVDQAELTPIVEKIEHPAMWAAADMEFNGVPVDQEVFSILKAEVEPQVTAAKAKVEAIFAEVGIDKINLNSYKQVIKALAAVGIEVTSTAENALKEIDHPIIDDLLAYKSATKLMQFVNKLPTHVDPVTGRIHCSFNMLGTVTGRVSCLSPNLQQIPRNPFLRTFIKANKGYKIVVADYSQIELVLAAEISQDPTMVKAYNEGADIHRITASLLLNKPPSEITKQERQLAKAVNFGLVYGMGAAKLVLYSKNTYGVKMTLEEAQEYRSKFFQTYPGLMQWHQRSSHEIKAYRPKFVKTLSGRKRLFSHDKFAHNAIRFTSYVNTQDQGTGGDITKRALAKCRSVFIGHDVNLILQVHDEICLEVREDLAEWAATTLEKCMVEAGKEFVKTVPVMVEVSIADSWGDAK
jgi:DNA polymerase I-like protein with 3'-5' exonuclease and polymerase domains